MPASITVRAIEPFLQAATKAPNPSIPVALRKSRRTLFTSSQLPSLLFDHETPHPTAERGISRSIQGVSVGRKALVQIAMSIIATMVFSKFRIAIKLALHTVTLAEAAHPT
jgi:hypothetical protein